MDEVLRLEQKYLLTLEQYYRCRHEIEQVLRPDSYSGLEGYWIRSLYFDSLSNRDYREKQAGIKYRRKVRLRIYSPDARTAKLEIKQKENIWQRKISIPLTRPEAEKVVQGNYSVLLAKGQEAVKAYAMMNTFCYRPKSVVTYFRQAYTGAENHLRITFDKEITTSQTHLHLFEKGNSDEMLQNPYFVIMEVKFHQFVPAYVKEILNHCEVSAGSFSKYMMSRDGALLSAPVQNIWEDSCNIGDSPNIGKRKTLENDEKEKQKELKQGEIRE